MRLLTLCLILAVILAVPKVRAADQPVILFDQGHGERFLPQGDDALGLSHFAELIHAQGGRLVIVQTSLSSENLAAADALIISGPFTPLSTAEIDLIEGFVNRGGHLAVMLHIATPLAELLGRFGVIHSNGVIREDGAAVIDREPLNFRVARFEEHPLLTGISHFSLYGGWALATEGDRARLIAATGDQSWIDLNNNRKLDQGDARQSFGVIAAGQAGAGTFVIFGDDAIFQNRYLNGGNLKLATNLIQSLKP